MHTSSGLMMRGPPPMRRPRCFVSSCRPQGSAWQGSRSARTAQRQRPGNSRSASLPSSVASLWQKQSRNAQLVAPMILPAYLQRPTEHGERREAKQRTQRDGPRRQSPRGRQRNGRRHRQPASWPRRRQRQVHCGHELVRHGRRALHCGRNRQKQMPWQSNCSRRADSETRCAPSWHPPAKKLLRRDERHGVPRRRRRTKPRNGCGIKLTPRKRRSRNLTRLQVPLAVGLSGRRQRPPVPGNSAKNLPCGQNGLRTHALHCSANGMKRFSARLQQKAGHVRRHTALALSSSRRRGSVRLCLRRRRSWSGSQRGMSRSGWQPARKLWTWPGSWTTAGTLMHISWSRSRSRCCLACASSWTQSTSRVGWMGRTFPWVR